MIVIWSLTEDNLKSLKIDFENNNFVYAGKWHDGTKAISVYDSGLFRSYTVIPDWCKNIVEIKEVNYSQVLNSILNQP